MFDSLKFALADSNGRQLPAEFTTLGLLYFLFHTKLIIRDNAYDICDWLAHAEPRKVYNAGSFLIIALDY